MLSILRRHAASTMIKVILGLIVVVFIFWGFEGFNSARSGRVALVNGETISLEDYHETYNNLIERYRRQYGERFNDDLLKTLEPRKQALETLINRKIMEMEARKLDFRVSDRELADFIRSLDYFKTGDSFDNHRYQQILRRIRSTPEEFEEQQRLALLIQKAQNFVMDSVRVSDAEALEYFKWDNTSVNIDYVVFEPRKYEGFEPQEGELEAFFGENKEEFRIKPKRKVRYVHLNPGDFSEKAREQVSDEQVKEYYDAHTDEFKQEETVEAKHILIKVDENAEEAVVEEKRQQIAGILEKARAGEDFATLAKEYSEGPSKDNGGDLGAFGRGQMVKPFEDAAFSMKAGEISDPVRTRFGWHIIKVENVNEAKTLTLEEASEKIRDNLAATSSKDLAKEAAEKIYESSFEGDDMVKAAQNLEVEVKTTGFFTDAGPEDWTFLTQKKIADIAFSLKEMEISQIADLSDGYYIVQLIETQESRLPEFEEVRDQALAKWEAKQQEDAARKNAAAFLEQLKAGKTMEEISGEYDVAPAETDFFRRNQAIPKIGFNRELSDAAFALTEKDKFPEAPLQSRKGFYVIGFKERKTQDAESFETKRKDIIRLLLARKQMKALEDWIDQARKNSEIVVEPQFISG